MQKCKSQPLWCILIANRLYSAIWLVKALTCDKCIMAQVLPGHVKLLMLNYAVVLHCLPFKGGLPKFCKQSNIKCV